MYFYRWLGLRYGASISRRTFQKTLIRKAQNLTSQNYPSARGPSVSLSHIKSKVTGTGFSFVIGLH